MQTVAAFVASLGVNTHMDAQPTGYANVTVVGEDLAYLGFGKIRDHAWDVDLAAYRRLAAAGIKFDLIVDDQPAASVAAMAPLKGSIVAFEGANEVDITHTPVATALLQQQALYAAVKSNPALAGIPVLNASIGDPNNALLYAGTGLFSDVANLHAYAAWGDMPRYALPARTQQEGIAGKPSVITETGYFTLLNNKSDPSGVSESVQAKLTLDTIFDSFSAGITQTYLYELLDEAPDPSGSNGELHYGLFRADGTPKPAATALHNLTTILAAPGSAVPKLNVTFSGLPDNAGTLTLAGANDSAFITVWAEPQIWNTAKQTENAAPSSSVKVDLGAVVGSVSVYDPTVGTAPIATYSNVAQVSIAVSDHPVIIRASGAATAQAVPQSGGPSRDSLAASAGSRIVDAASGPVMSGAAGRTTNFFVDAATAPKAAITNMHKGDSVTLWGFTGNAAALTWKANGSFAGYDGATLQATTATGKLSLTFATATMREVHTMLGVTTGSAGGTPFLRLTETI